MTDSENGNIKDLGPSFRAAIYLAVLVNLHGKFAESAYQKRSKKDF